MSTYNLRLVIIQHTRFQDADKFDGSCDDELHQIHEMEPQPETDDHYGSGDDERI